MTASADPTVDHTAKLSRLIYFRQNDGKEKGHIV